MDLVWIWCGYGVDLVWSWCGSGVDQVWIGTGSGVDLMWIWCVRYLADRVTINRSEYEEEVKEVGMWKL